MVRPVCEKLPRRRTPSGGEGGGPERGSGGGTRRAYFA